MSEAVPRRHKRCTWDDYRGWDDGQRWEILDGEAYSMSPAPAIKHQRVLWRLIPLFDAFFEGKKCEPFAAPTDVKLSDEDVVQPDLLVVCEPDKIKTTHIEGTPTLIVEILSPSTALFDRARKMRTYAKFAVREVWLVTPYPGLVEVFVLDGESYRLCGAYTKEDTLTSPTFPELEIDLRKVFDFPIEPDERIEMVKEGRPPYGKKRASHSRKKPKPRNERKARHKKMGV